MRKQGSTGFADQILDRAIALYTEGRLDEDGRETCLQAFESLVLHAAMAEPRKLQLLPIATTDVSYDPNNAFPDGEAPGMADDNDKAADDDDEGSFDDLEEDEAYILPPTLIRILCTGFALTWTIFQKDLMIWMIRPGGYGAPRRGYCRR